MELEDEDLIVWVKKELNGYTTGDELLDYRVVYGIVRGDFLISGYGGVFTYQNQVLSTNRLPDKFKDEIEHKKYMIV